MDLIGTCHAGVSAPGALRHARQTSPETGGNPSTDKFQEWQLLLDHEDDYMWVGRKKLAFVPVYRPHAAPPDLIPGDWPDQITRRVLFDPDPATGADRSLRAYVRAASSGLADLDMAVMPMVTIDEQNVIAADHDAELGGPALRAEGFDAAAAVMLGGVGAGMAQAYWDRFVMVEKLGVWAMEFMHTLTGLPDLRDLIPPYSDSPNDEGDIGNFDEMAFSSGMHPCAYTKRAIGWLDPSSVVLNTGKQSTYQLHAIGLPQPPPLGRVAAVQIGTQVPYLMVEARLRVDQFESPSTLEPGIPSEGVIVYRVQTTDPLGHAQNNLIPLFLLTPTALGVGQSFTSDTGVSIKVNQSIPGGFSVAIENPNAPTLVPNVFQLFVPQAQALITEAGLVPAIVSGTASSHAWVASQSPAAGDLVAPGSTVSLRVKTGPIQ